MFQIIRGRASGLTLDKLLSQEMYVSRIIVHVIPHIKILIVGRTGNSLKTQEKGRANNGNKGQWVTHNQSAPQKGRGQCSVNRAHPRGLQAVQTWSPGPRFSVAKLSFPRLHLPGKFHCHSGRTCSLPVVGAEQPEGRTPGAGWSSET